MDGNMKHIKKYRGFKNWLSEAKGYYIKVSLRDSKKALAILDEMYGKKFDISGSDTYYFKNEDMAHDAKYDLAARDIQVTDTNIEESAITERNAFLGARAKAIEEDLEEFEFNGKTYPVTIKNVDEGAPNYDDANFNLDKIFGDDQESIETFQDIEDNGTVEDMIDYIDNWGDEEMLQRYGIRSTAHVKKLAKKIMEGKVTEDRFGNPMATTF